MRSKTNLDSKAWIPKSAPNAYESTQAHTSAQASRGLTRRRLQGWCTHAMRKQLQCSSQNRLSEVMRAAFALECDSRRKIASVLRASKHETDTRTKRRASVATERCDSPRSLKQRGNAAEKAPGGGQTAGISLVPSATGNLSTPADSQEGAMRPPCFPPASHSQRRRLLHSSATPRNSPSPVSKGARQRAPATRRGPSARPRLPSVHATATLPAVEGKLPRPAPAQRCSPPLRKVETVAAADAASSRRQPAAAAERPTARRFR